MAHDELYEQSLIQRLNEVERTREWLECELREVRNRLQRTRALIKTRLDKLYFGEERMLHGAILAQIRKEMPIGKFMTYVHRAKQEAGL